MATEGDAAAIAAMSRDEIERGLGWSWNEARVRRSILDPNTNVAIIRENGSIAAFGIMSYREDSAHLLLFAVRRSQQRQGLGSTMLSWLEEVARAAGLQRVHVECRRVNVAARNFYGEHGYHEQVISKGYYSGVEDAIRLEKWLATREGDSP